MEMPFFVPGEIYDLKLNADLMVLSACNTGYGKQVNGEGVISLGRSMTQAGCLSIVQSLWPVQDKASATIMKLFYDGLAEEKEVSEALRLAKLSWLMTAAPEDAAPYNWAAFVVVGSGVEFGVGELGPSFLYLWLLLSFLVGVFGIYLVYRWILSSRSAVVSSTE